MTELAVAIPLNFHFRECFFIHSAPSRIGGRISNPGATARKMPLKKGKLAGTLFFIGNAQQHGIKDSTSSSKELGFGTEHVASSHTRNDSSAALRFGLSGRAVLTCLA